MVTPCNVRFIETGDEDHLSVIERGRGHALPEMLLSHALPGVLPSWHFLAWIVHFLSLVATVNWCWRPLAPETVATIKSS